MVANSSPSTAINGSTQSSTPSTKFVPISFTNLTTVRLDNNNFLGWRKQVLSAVKGHKLHNFLFGSITSPQKFLRPEDEGEGSVNPAGPVTNVLAPFDHDGFSVISCDQVRDY